MKRETDTISTCTWQIHPFQNVTYVPFECVIKKESQAH